MKEQFLNNLVQMIVSRIEEVFVAAVDIDLVEPFEIDQNELEHDLNLDFNIYQHQRLERRRG